MTDTRTQTTSTGKDFNNPDLEWEKWPQTVPVDTTARTIAWTALWLAVIGIAMGMAFASLILDHAEFHL